MKWYVLVWLITVGSYVPKEYKLDDLVFYNRHECINYIQMTKITLAANLRLGLNYPFVIDDYGCVDEMWIKTMGLDNIKSIYTGLKI